MTRVELLAELKIVLDESTYDGGWSDTTLIGYLTEGQDKFCEDTGYFRDQTTSDICSLDVIDGTDLYSVSDRIIEVLEVYEGTRRLGKLQDDPSRAVNAEPFDFSNTSGALTHWRMDMEIGSIKLYPVPAADTTLTLRVWRYSVTSLDDGTAPDPELPSRLQRACIEWAAYKALMHHDMEAQDPVKANDHFQSYMQYVRDGRHLMRRRIGQDVWLAPDPSYVV